MKTYGRLHYRAGEALLNGHAGLWIIEAEPNVIVRVKRIFPRVTMKREGTLVMTDTAELARELTWVLDRWPLDMDAATRARLEGRTAEWRDAQDSVERILDGQRLEYAMEPAREPRDYQLVAADLALTTGRLLLLDEIGLGKSFSALLMLRDPRALPALVVCDAHLPSQWLAELHESFPLLRGHIVKTTTVYDPARKREMRGHRPDVLIMSYSKLDGWASHLAGQVRTVIFDEIQSLRRSSSKKYVAAGLVADAAQFRCGTTATPVYNYGGEIYNVLSVLDRDALGSRAEFVAEWGQELGKGKVAVKDPRALGAFLREQHLALRRTRKEVGRELGEAVRVPHTVEADVEVLEQEAADATDLAQLIVDGAGTRQERFTAAGDLDWQMRRATGLAKASYVAAFVTLLLESERKVVLWGWHRDVYTTWLNRLTPYGAVMYTGSESPSAKHYARERFVNDEDCRVLIMSLRSGAGLDGLQDVCHVGVFGELDWSPAMHDQCVGRLRRDGQDEPVVAYFLTCDHGSDPTVMATLGVKRGQAEPIVDPDIALFERTEAPVDRVRQLATAVLAKRPRTKALA